MTGMIHSVVANAARITIPSRSPSLVCPRFPPHAVLVSLVPSLSPSCPPRLPFQVVEAALRALRMLRRCPGLMQRASSFLWGATTHSANTNTAEGSAFECNVDNGSLYGAGSSNGNGTNSRDATGSVNGTGNSTVASSTVANSTVASKKEGRGSPWVFKAATESDKAAMDSTAQLLLHLLLSKCDAVAEVSMCAGPMVFLCGCAVADGCAMPCTLCAVVSAFLLGSHEMNASPKPLSELL